MARFHSITPSFPVRYLEAGAAKIHLGGWGGYVINE